MKKIFFLYILLVIQFVDGFYEKREIACVRSNEKILRHMLYRSYARDNIFYMKKCSCFHAFENKDSICSSELFSNIDFFIRILEDHVIKLQKKILKPKHFLQKKATWKGFGFLSIGMIFGASSYLFFTNISWPRKENYLEKITDLQKALECARNNWHDPIMQELIRKDFQANFEPMLQFPFNRDRKDFSKDFEPNFRHRFQYLQDLRII